MGSLRRSVRATLRWPNGNALDVFDIAGYLLPIGGAPVKRVASAIETDLFGDRHENGVVRGTSHSFAMDDLRGAFFFRNNRLVRMLTLASTMKVSTGRSTLARTHACRKYPPSDVLGGRVSENAVRQDDAHPSAGLEPVETAFDEQNLGGHAPLQFVPCSESLPSSVLLPGMCKIECFEDVDIGNRDARPERWVGHHHVHGFEWRLLARRVPRP